MDISALPSPISRIRGHVGEVRTGGPLRTALLRSPEVSVVTAHGQTHLCMAHSH